MAADRLENLLEFSYSLLSRFSLAEAGPHCWSCTGRVCSLCTVEQYWSRYCCSSSCQVCSCSHCCEYLVIERATWILIAAGGG